MSLTINTLAGPIQQITFKEFLNRIAVRTVTGAEAGFNAQVSIGSDAQLDDGTVHPTWEESSYIRKLLPLLKPLSDEQRELICLRDLLSQASIGHLWKAPLMEQIETMCVDILNNFGNPDSLVELLPGVLLLASSHDYLIYEGEKGVSLACLYPHRTIAYQVSSLTLDEALKLASPLAEVK